MTHMALEEREVTIVCATCVLYCNVIKPVIYRFVFVIRIKLYDFSDPLWYF